MYHVLISCKMRLSICRGLVEMFNGITYSVFNSIKELVLLAVDYDDLKAWKLNNLNFMT